MSSIDRVIGQDAARTYIQNAELTRSNAAAAGAQQAARTNAQHQPSKADSVTLSANARSLAAAREAVQNAPAVRENKVAEIKQSIDSGTYSVSSSVLARKMLRGNN